MVRLAAAMALILWASVALGQEGSAPPLVASEAPVLGNGAGADEAMPVLPKADGPTLGAAEVGTEAPYHTDLASLVLKAHPVVQAVMALLALAVMAVLTVLLFKLVEFPLAFARLRRTKEALAAAPGLAAVTGHCPLALASEAAVDEVQALGPAMTADLRRSARERLDLALDRIEAGAVLRLRSGTGLLASIGAVGPFVGLFGTVFGIMNSFLAIAGAKTTSLVVVAPGIAEALLATGIGLVAAIPAVLLYNAIQRRIVVFRHGFADGRAEILARFSRALDQRMEA
ncbi:MotA/TolQ/ExbB proton channel family protein [Rhodobacter sp. SY28-1]|uniref:MotA/TolQ/ExbB proton channel family protein n=1 Tax=Rhodobacter sp. SY28-1 TaxID=2562317 RepID=UPI0010BF944B|nr:MotA/TolQ/ExbB proton channel family protein [Rhodobacter sp. SY28-1]